MSRDALVEKGVELLKGRLHSASDFDEVADALAEEPGFEDLLPNELDEVAAAVRARLPARASGGRSGTQRAGQRPVPPSAAPPRAMPQDVGAPFRFVILPDEVMAREADGRHDRPVQGGISARIQVLWAAETPLLVGEEVLGSEVVEPLRLGKNGPYAIPGATWRGALRSAVEIVAYGRIGGQANLHHRYGLRDFEHESYVEKPVSRVGEVRAGWLEWPDGDGSTWTIRPLADSWSHVRIEEMLASDKAFSKFDLRSWNASSLWAKYETVGMARKDRTFDFRKTRGFGSPSLDRQGRRVVPSTGARAGVLVFANRLPGGGNKKHEYVFFGDGGTPVRLGKDIVAVFQRLYSKPSKNRPEPDGSWKDLVETLRSGGRVPVFYVGDLEAQGGDFFFGLTRLFKIPHDWTVGDVLAAQPAHLGRVERTDEKVIGYDADFVENLFGYVVEGDALGLDNTERVSPDAVGRKGRIAFGFTLLDNPGAEKVSDPVSLVLMAPRASFAPFYLRSVGALGAKDYSAKPLPRVAGRKRYLPRANVGQTTEAMLKRIVMMGQRQLERIKKSSPSSKVSEDVVSRLRFLMPKGKDELLFCGEIRLHNVSAAELGAVLFALTHGGDPEKPCRHMIGRAKAFGAGQMRLVSAKLSVTPNDEAAKELIEPPKDDERVRDRGRRGFIPAPVDGEETGDNTYRNASHRPFLHQFGKLMRERLKSTAYPDVPAVKEFLGASDPGETAKIEASLDYMELKTFGDVRKATKPLRSDKYEKPAMGKGERDGRLLPAPSTTSRWLSESFWK